VIYIMAWPHSTLDEMATFLWNEGGRLFSRQAISKCLEEMGVTKKRVYTEAYQAQSDVVLFHVWGFWNCPPSLGNSGVARSRLIDFVEFGAALEKCNHSGGWKLLCIQKDGNYHHGLKITALFAIEPGDLALLQNSQGSVERPQ
jgi:hypothetical protein